LCRILNSESGPSLVFRGYDIDASWRRAQLRRYMLL